jgi:hypothetical protein
MAAMLPVEPAETSANRLPMVQTGQDTLHGIGC